MVDSPASLQDILIEYVAVHIGDVCLVTCYLKDGRSRLCFRDSNSFWPPKLANALFRFLDRKKLLNDVTLTLLDPNVFRLTHVALNNTTGVTLQGLKILAEHHLQSLEFRTSVDTRHSDKITIDDLISCLGQWTLDHLYGLSISGCRFSPAVTTSPMVPRLIASVRLGSNGLHLLRNLHVLDVSNTELATHTLLNVCCHLHKLASLNISNCAQLESVECLRIRAKTLHSLIMHNVKALYMEDTKEVLLSLTQLTHLDVSCNRIGQDPVELLMPPKTTVLSSLLENPDFVPQLRYLDISGQDEVQLTELHTFLKNHSQLEFLGLMLTPLGLDTVFLDEYNVTVTGVACTVQLVEALRRYIPRKEYVTKILYKLFMLTSHFEEPRPDIIMLITPSMTFHDSHIAIQLAGTACLYNLTKGAIGERVHPHVLSQVVQTTLQAMNNFPSHGQLQKNALLTLCCDRILHEVPFDKFLCVRLVLDCLLKFNDPSTDRMAVAICSILAAKISTVQTTKLSSQSVYIKKLLNLVDQRMTEGGADMTLKFTLSALWNLTDESPSTCGVFIVEDGLKIYIKVLQSFSGESAIETKVLGLLNNIAEVPTLRRELINQEIMTVLRHLLWSPCIDVSYFTAGILAHLVSADEDLWADWMPSRDELVDDLGRAVLAWEQPKEEMVAYRSFQPFIALLKSWHMYQVQLWAVWALSHVTARNSKRYCTMIVQEAVDETLREVVERPTVNEHVKGLAARVLQLVGVSWHA